MTELQQTVNFIQSALEKSGTSGSLEYQAVDKILLKEFAEERQLLCLEAVVSAIFNRGTHNICVGNHRLLSNCAEERNYDKDDIVC